MRSPDEELMRRLGIFSHEETEVLPEVERLLAQGAHPNQTRRDKHNFACAVGMAAAQAWPQVVQALLNAGGKPVWPTEEIEIPNEALVGHKRDESYRGPPCDPLVWTTEKLAWSIIEYEDDVSNQVKRREIDRYYEIARTLLSHGAPVERADPANGRAPLDNLLILICENMGRQTLSEKSRDIVADLMIHALTQHPDPAPYLQKVVNGNWEQLPFGQWEWHDDHPEITPGLVTRAERLILASDTLAASRNRTQPRL